MLRRPGHLLSLIKHETSLASSSAGHCKSRIILEIAVTSRAEGHAFSSIPDCLDHPWETPQSLVKFVFLMWHVVRGRGGTVWPEHNADAGAVPAVGPGTDGERGLHKGGGAGEKKKRPVSAACSGCKDTRHVLAGPPQSPPGPRTSWDRGCRRGP